MKIAMYIITHKEFECPKIAEYIPLQVGFKESFGDVRDNTGDNISEKNRNYCELTGIYWIWKNDTSSDVVGISHYRRYFTTHKVLRDFNKVLNCNDIEKLLVNYDIIVPSKEYYRETVKEQYCLYSGFEKDLDLTRDIIKTKYPEYVESFDKIMSQNYISQYNMMICRKEKYDEYCKWLFDILFEVEKNVNLDGYTDYQKRIYGFLSERLLNVWIDQSKLKTKFLRVINIEDSKKVFFRIHLRRYKNRIIYRMNKERN